MQELLAKLVSFKTTEDNPEEVKKGFAYIASFFDAEKYDIQRFEKNEKYSLLISFKGKDALRPQILLNGHFDVVPAESEDQYQVRIEGNKAYGRGTLDMKGMASVLIEVMLELGKQENPPDVALLLNADEEVGGSNGARYMVQEVGIKPEFVVCPDAPYEGEFKIVLKEKGIAWVDLEAKGKVAHGAYPWLGENALEKLIKAVGKIKEWVGPMDPGAWKTTVNFSVLEAPNKTPNKVPGEAKGLLDIRFTEQMAKTPEELLEKIKGLVPEISVTLREKGNLIFVEEQHPKVQAFKQIAQEVLGQRVNFTFEHGATDMRYFGVPGVLFGAKGHGMHAEGEWVSLQSLEGNKKILLRFLQEG
ncbi:MAG TPA: M20/M25/M40 family metallo-hydrolase [Candidatus Paceibacterota bacterium]